VVSPQESYNRTHVTSKYYFLNNKTWQTQRLDKKNLTTDKEASKKNRPFLRRTFCKEVNTLVRKAGKERVLGLYAAALKRKQDKESKAKVAKRRAIEAEASLSSEDPVSVNNLEKPIPHKNAHQFVLPRLLPRSSPTRKRTKRRTMRKWTLGFCLL
jgi:hypothetical protein